MELEVRKNKYLGSSYEVIGEGKPILCFSGFGCSNYNFDFIRSELAKEYKLILVNNRGMGDSKKVSEPYLISDLARDGLNIMTSLGHNSFYVFGISMGGFIAQELALMSPSFVKGLILGCTTSGGEDFPVLNKLDEESIKRSFALDPMTYNTLVLNATVHPEIIENEKEIYQSILETRIGNMPDVSQVLLQQKAVDHFLSKEMELEKINCPTLILSGDSDRFVSPESSKVLSEKIRNSELVFIEKADHHFFMERPSETAGAVKTFLEKL